MDWTALGAAAEHFILTVGWKIGVVFSVIVLIWKYMDMRSKGVTLWGKKKPK